MTLALPGLGLTTTAGPVRPTAAERLAVIRRQAGLCKFCHREPPPRQGLNVVQIGGAWTALCLRDRLRWDAFDRGAKAGAKLRGRRRSSSARRRKPRAAPGQMGGLS